MTAVLYWDIDGTLLTTGRAGVFAFEEAVEEVAGVRASFQEIPTSGLTDAEVAALFLREAGVDARDGLVERVLRAYERRLPAALPRRRGSVMPGVREVLDDLAGDPGVTSLLLTGNTEAGARAKLAHYDLERYFPHGGAFCLGPGERVEIARRAHALAPPDATPYVIGDTPADVACGKAVGARAVAVASGAYDAGALAEHDPWLVLERIPEPRAFRAALALPT